MISKRKIAANKRNAARSTGPKTADGKTRAGRNAYRHGLAVSVLNDPAISSEVERLARAIVGKRSNLYELVQARIIAEAEFDLLRVRSTRVHIIDAAGAARGSSNLTLAKEGQAQNPLLPLLALRRCGYSRRRAWRLTGAHGRRK